MVAGSVPFFVAPRADKEGTHGREATTSKAFSTLALPGRRPRPAQSPVQKDPNGSTPSAQGERIDRNDVQVDAI